MDKRIIAFVTGIGLLWLGGTVVALETTQEMMRYCQRPDGNVFRTHCHSYVSGIVDVQASYVLSNDKGAIMTCLPEGVNARQAAQIFVKWGKENPEFQHRPAYEGIISSLHNAFKCKLKE